MFRRPPSPAGLSAKRKYEELSAAWRHRNRRAFLHLAAALGACAIAINIYAAFFGGLNWGAGVVTGVAIGLFWQERANPPEWIARWQTGAWGEQLTAQALLPLEAEGWRVLHDLPTEAGTNLDHVVVGPGGVFLLDTKSVDGTVSAEGTTATVTRPGSELSYRQDFGRQMRGQAREVHERLLAATGARQWVTPVVVIWSEGFEQRAVGDRDGVLVAGSALAAWLRDQPQRVAPQRVRQFSDALAG